MIVDLFAKFLVDSQLAGPEEIDEFTTWIYRFLTLKLPGDMSSEEKMAVFVETLQSDDSVDDEQLAQAKYAVWVYLHDFLGAADDSNDRESTNKYETLETLRGVLQLKHYSESTINIYVPWVERFMDYCDERKRKYDEPESVAAFVKFLGGERGVAPSTRNQAVNAISFLFVNVFDSTLNHIKTATQVKTERKIPDVLTVDELKALFNKVEGTERLILEFVYATGVTVSELRGMRINALDFDNREVAIFDDSSFDERTVPMPERLVDPLMSHLKRLKDLHDNDLAISHGRARFTPKMKEVYAGQEKEWKWQYLFPSDKLFVDKAIGEVYRDRIPAPTIQSIVKKAARAAGLDKSVSVHTLRHSYAVHLLMNGVGIDDLQTLLGHKNIETTMIYMQVLKQCRRKPVSPFDLL